MALTFWRPATPATKSHRGRRCGQGVQTRRLRCAQPGDRIVETAALTTSRAPRTGKTRSTGCVEEKLRVDFPADDPHRVSTGTGRQPVDNLASASGPEAIADLIIFDGVFDRRIRSTASGRGHRRARRRP